MEPSSTEGHREKERTTWLSAFIMVRFILGQPAVLLPATVIVRNKMHAFHVYANASRHASWIRT